MALSNIFREPRREITESAIGLAVAAAVLVIVVPLDWQFALWFCRDDHPDRVTVDFCFGLFFGAAGLLIGSMALGGFVVATHALGDGVCNFLERFDIHLRPRVRPNQ